MRLAFYSLLRNHNWGGSENLWYKTALLALENNHQVLIIVHENLNDILQGLTLKSKGAEILVVQEVLTNVHHKIINNFFPSFSKKYLQELAIKKIKKFQTELIVFNQPGGYDILYNPLAIRLIEDINFRCYILTHSYSIYDNLSDEQKSKLAKTFALAQESFFVSDRQANYIFDYLKIKLENWKVVSNPLNLKRKEILAFPKNCKTIKMAMVTTLFFASKGIDNLIRILAKPSLKQINWRLEIYGTGPDKSKLEQLILEHGLAQEVILMGFSNNVETIWEKNEILLMPSLVDAAPTVLLEAMACGRTAVCTNIGFCDEWIEHNVSGFISPTVSQEDFEIALLDALENYDKWEEMGKKCYQLVCDKHPNLPELLFLKNLLNEQ